MTDRPSRQTGTSSGPADRRLSPRWIAIAASVFLLASLVAVVFALVGIWGDWGRLDGSTAEWRPRPLWLIGALVSGAGALLASGAIWATLFRSAGGQTGVREGTAAWLGSNLGRYIPGKVWQVTGLAAYVRAKGDSGSTALAILLSFQAIMLATGTAVGIAALGTRAFGAAGPWPLFIALGAILMAVHPRVLAFVAGVGRRLLKEREDVGAPSVRPGNLVLAALGGLSVWALHGLGFWALTQGLISDHALTPQLACGIFATSYVTGYIVLVAPGGMVVREGAIAGLLGVFLGIPLGPAAALALAARVWSTTAELLAFGLATVLGMRGSRGSR